MPSRSASRSLCTLDLKKGLIYTVIDCRTSHSLHCVSGRDKWIFDRDTVFIRDLLSRLAPRRFASTPTPPLAVARKTFVAV